MEEFEFKLGFFEMKNKCFEGLGEYEEKKKKTTKNKNLGRL